MTWETIQFDKIITSHGVGKNGLSKKDWSEDGKYPVIGQGADFIEGWTNREDLVINPDFEGLVIYGGHTRRAKYITTPFVPGPNVKILKTPPEVKPRFLFYFLNSTEIPNKGYADHFPLVKKIKVPIPSIKEQERIVALLEQAEDLKKKRAEADQKMEELIPALFNEMFGKNLENIKTEKLSNLLNITGGGTPSKNNEQFWGGNIPWVSPKDMKTEYINDSIDHITQEAIKESSTNLIPEGSILLVTRSGILQHTLPIAINTRELTINQDIKALINKEPKKINSLFAYTQLKIREKEILSMVKTGATVQSINTDYLKKLELYIPDINLQEEFSNKIEQILEYKNKQKESTSQLDELFTSILSKSI